MKKYYINLLVFCCYGIIVLSAGFHTRWSKIFVEKQKLGERKNIEEKEEAIFNINSYSVIQIASQIDWTLLACILNATQLLLSSGTFRQVFCHKF